MNARTIAAKINTALSELVGLDTKFDRQKGDSNHAELTVETEGKIYTVDVRSVD